MNNLQALQIMQGISRKFLLMNQSIDRAILKDKTMAVSPAVATLISEFDAATDKIAARIQTLINNSTSLSADDTAALQAEVDKLNLLGQDPENPVPPAVG